MKPTSPSSGSIAGIIAPRPTRRGLLVGGSALGLSGLLVACGVGGGGGKKGGGGSGSGSIRALFMQ